MTKEHSVERTQIGEKKKAVLRSKTLATGHVRSEHSSVDRSTNRRFSIRTSQCTSPRRSLDCCKVLLGAGTQGSTVVDMVVRRLTDELGDLPLSLCYLTLDGADGEKYLNPNRHVQFGVNGIGTDSARGQEAFLHVYDDVFRSAELSINQLNSSDSRMPAASGPGEGLDFIIVSGNGGSSGGLQQILVTLVNQLGIKLAISNFRVKLYFIAPDVSLNDPTRSISLNQHKTVMQTAACNLTQLNADFHVKELREFHTPIVDGFSMSSSERVWAPYLMTGSNGRKRISLVSDFNEMLSEIVLLTEFTRAGVFLEDRVKDPEQLGDFSRGRMEPC